MSLIKISRQLEERAENTNLENLHHRRHNNANCRGVFQRNKCKCVCVRAGRRGWGGGGAGRIIVIKAGPQVLFFRRVRLGKCLLLSRNKPRGGNLVGHTSRGGVKKSDSETEREKEKERERKRERERVRERERERERTIETERRRGERERKREREKERMREREREREKERARDFRL